MTHSTLNSYIPISYYFGIWLKTTVMATFTGFIAGFLMPGGIGAIIGIIVGPFWALWISYNFFWGKKRGQFEYDFSKKQALKKARKILIDTIGWFSCQRLYLSELGEISWSEGEAYKGIIMNSKIEDEYKYYIYIRAADVCLRKQKYENAINNLGYATQLYHEALVSNFMLAQSFERVDEAEKAISAYKNAAKDPLWNSKYLQKYINDQVKRVQTKGPRKKAPMPGLRHLGLGR